MSHFLFECHLSPIHVHASNVEEALRGVLLGDVEPSRHDYQERSAALSGSNDLDVAAVRYWLAEAFEKSLDIVIVDQVRGRAFYVFPTVVL